MEGEEEEKSNLEADNLRLIDFSSDDDLLVGSLCDEAFDGLRLSVNFENRNERERLKTFNISNQPDLENAVGLFRQGEEEPVSSASVDPNGASRYSTSSSRKSLAWDSAFFTSEGILDPEELSIVTKGFAKGRASFLHGILEDMQKSTEPNSALDTDSFSLGSFEIDLFEDIRKSIQKSFNVGSAGFSGWSASTQSSSKNSETTSQNKMKKTSAPRRQNVGVRGSGRIKRGVTAHPQTAKNDTRVRGFSSAYSLNKLGQTKPMLKTPSKGDSSGANRHNKMDEKAPRAASVKGLKVSKNSSVGEFTKVLPGFTLPSELSSTTASPASTVSSSHDTPNSASSTQSSLNSSRKKIDSGNAGVTLSGSNLKISKRYSKTSKPKLGNPSIFTNPLSQCSPSSCTSPATSIDGCFSESSSSSSSAVYQAYTNSKSNMNTANGRVSSDSDTIQPYAELGSQETKIPSRCFSKAKPGISPMAKDAARNVKASSLCKPFPKIGYFDEEKSSASTLDVNLQFRSRVRSALPKTGTGICNAKGMPRMTRPSKPQPSRTPSANEGYCTGTSKKIKSDALTVSRKKCLNSSEIGSGDRASRQLEDKQTENKRQAHIRAKKNSSRRDGVGFLEIDLNSSKTKPIWDCHDQNLLKGDGKWNIFMAEDEVDGLSKQVAALNSCGDVIIELKGKKGQCHLQSSTECTENYSEEARDFPKTDEYIPSLRTPLAVKDSLCNLSEEKAI